MKRYLLDVYLAFNLGDDMFLDHLAESFPGIEFVPFYPGNNYKKFFLNYPNVRKFSYGILDKALSRLKIYNRLTDYNRIARDYDGLVFLGGGIFREEGYWPELYEYRDKMASAFIKENKPVSFLGCNFGPYQTEKFKDLHRKLFYKCKDVCFRDISSYNLFKDLENVRFAPDILWDFKYPAVKTKPNLLGISVIDPQHKPGLEKYRTEYIAKHIEIIKEYLSQNYQVRLFSFCESEGDLEICTGIASAIPGKVAVYNYKGNIRECLKEFGECTEVIAARFHANVIAMKYQIPVLPVIYSDKTRNLLNDINFHNAKLEFKDLNRLKKINIQTYKFPDLSLLFKNQNRRHFQFV